MNVPPVIADWVLKTGKWSFTGDALLLALNHWNIINISKTIIIDLMWLYLVLGSLGAASIIYRRYSKKPSKLICPYCKGELLQSVIYECPSCGKLKPEK